MGRLVPSWISGCPSRAALSRERHDASGELAHHLSRCDDCRRITEAAREVSALARALPAIGLANSVRTRSAILGAIRARGAAGTHGSKETPESKRAGGRLPLIRYALTAAVVFMVAAPPPDPINRQASLASIDAVDRASFTQTRELIEGKANEVVRLEDGRVRVAVTKLYAGERFRVATDDAEVEVRGTAFDVVAEHGFLRAVVVQEGVVAVRVRGEREIVLRAGDRWARAERATAPQPDTADRAPAGFGEGMFALRRGEFRAAADTFARAAHDGGPLEEDALYWHAIALARSGASARARAALTEWLARYPSSPRAGEASVILGWLDLDARDLELARRHLVRGLDDPRPAVKASARAGLVAIE
jgi:FecR-like protein